MNMTQFLIFELCTECNMAKEHEGLCPNLHPERYARGDCIVPLTDDKIISLAVNAYNDLGFTGMIAWHYYNEPLMAKDRMLRLMGLIKSRVPQARFALWTNGVMIPADASFLKGFDACWITDYGRQDFRRVRKHVGKLNVMRWNLDGRLDPRGRVSRKPCGRMFSEFIIDYFGNVHICCMDWRGEVQVGNVWDESLGGILVKWQRIRNSISGREMTDIAPDLCQNCGIRHAHVANLVPEIAKIAKTHIKATTKPMGASPQALAKARGFCLLGMDCPAGDSEAWMEKHRGQADDLSVVSNWTEAESRLRSSGAYFGAVIRTSHFLEGDVLGTLAMHQNENLLQVAGEGLDGSPRRGVTIVRMPDVKAINRGRPKLRKRTKAAEIRLAKLKLISHEPDITKRLAVTFTHYGIPQHRLTEHFQWNDKLYLESGTRVFVVTDGAQYDVPDYATCIPYTEPMPVFSLARTSNYGIRYCLDSGFQTIIKSDTDVAFDEASYLAMLNPAPGAAFLPLYKMAGSFPGRETDFVDAPRATGTISMVASDWRQAHFDERCTGYGCDDGILRKSMQRAGIEVDRSGHLWHIAHIPGTPQKEFNKKDPRVDHWNRDSGFNPENFKGNRQFHRPGKSDAAWGLAGFSEITVVATHYRMPRKRLDAWFSWNDELFRTFKVRVIVVSDTDQRYFPSYARCAVYPIDLEMFNLSATSNYGIRLAGRGIICKTDPDCAFSAEALAAVASVVPGKGVSLKYYMADTFAGREASTATWDASKGTMALHFDHWDAICGYDERHEGYGIEDGDCFHRAGHGTGLHVDRIQLPFWHIAHTSETQGSASRRKDCWNRDNGFNPRNHRPNQIAMQTAWSCKNWGIPTPE